MATELASAYLTLIPSLKGAQKAIEGDLQGVDTTSVGQNLGSNLGKNMSSALSAVDIGNGIKSLGNQISSVGQSLTSNITKPAIAAGAAVASITIAKGFARLTAIDDARAKLQGLGHDASAIESIMDSATKSVKGTSFGLDEAATAAATAVAANVKTGSELTQYLKTVGNAAAISGRSLSDMGDLFGKVQTAGKASTLELNQLASSGIPIWQYLAQGMNATTEEVREFASQGKISSEIFLRAIDKNLGAVTGIAQMTGLSIQEVNSFLDDIGKDGVASLEELGAIAEMDIPIFDYLAKTMGITTEEVQRLAKEGKISSEQLKTAIDENIAGAAKIMGEASFTGALKNIWAAIGRVGANFLDAAGKGQGMFSQLKPLMVDLMNWIGKIEDKAVDVGVAFGGAFATIVIRSGDLLAALKPVNSSFGDMSIDAESISAAINSAFDWIIDKVEKINEFLGKFGTSIAEVAPKVALVAVAAGPVLTIVGGLISKLGGLVAFFGPIVTGMGNMSAGAKLFQAVLGGLASPIGLVIAGIGLLIAVSPELRQALGKAFESLGPIVESVVGVLMEVVSTLISALMPAFEKIGQAVSNFVDALVPLIEAILSSLIPVLEAIIPAIEPVISTITDLLIPVFEAILNTVVEVFEALMPIIEPVLGAIQSIIQVVTALIQGDWEAVWEGIMSFYANVWEFLRELPGVVLEVIKSVVSNAWDAVSKNFSTVWDGISTYFGGVWDDMCSYVDDGINNILDWVGSLPDKIKGFFANAGTWLLDAGVSIMKGFFDGLLAQWREVQNWFGGIGDWIVQNKGPKEYDLKLLVPAGTWIMTGLFEGLKSQIPTLKHVLNDITSLVSDWDVSTAIPDSHLSANATISTQGYNVAHHHAFEVAEDKTNAEVAEAIDRIDDTLVWMVDRIEQLKITLDERKTIGALTPGIDRELKRREKLGGGAL